MIRHTSRTDLRIRAVFWSWHRLRYWHLQWAWQHLKNSLVLYVSGVYLTSIYLELAIWIEHQASLVAVGHTGDAMVVGNTGDVVAGGHVGTGAQIGVAAAQEAILVAQSSLGE